MKTIILMRHAEAPNVIGNDFDRTLSEHGKSQALKAADFLKDYKIDIIITSDAPRVLETSSPIEKLFPNTKIERDHLLYNGATSDYLEILEKLCKHFNNILLIGHNPNIFSLARLLPKSNQVKSEEICIQGMNPAKIIVFKIADEDVQFDILKNCTIENIFEPD